MTFTLLPTNKKQWLISLTSLFLFVGLLSLALYSLINMPGNSYSGSVKGLTSDEKSIQTRLTDNVSYLSETIGARSLSVKDSLDKSKTYLHEEITKIGYSFKDLSFKVKNIKVYNIEVTKEGHTDDTIIIGAHYDTCYYGPGANDNGTGVAAVLELLRHFKNKELIHSFHFVFFVNEEPPYFLGDQMGSIVYSKHMKSQNIKVKAMLSLETIGYFSDEKGSQKYPIDAMKLAYPSEGNFIAFVGNISSGPLVRKSIDIFRNLVDFPSEGLSAPKSVPGVGWSDHSSFWNQGYPAIMITDTAPFRYPHYHESTDTVDKLNLSSYTKVVQGIKVLITELDKSL